jgi:hypothetical protein
MMPRPKKLNKKTQTTLNHAVLAALYGIKKWLWWHRLKFCLWLLFGRKAWKGVK